MHRMEELKNEIEFRLSDISENEKRQAYEHIYGVVDLCVLLALRRGAEPSLCAACGYLHDVWSYENKSSENHARHGAILAKKILDELRTFDDYEIKTIVNAVKNHTNKGEQDDIYSEILKDADVVQRYLADPETKFSKSKAQRIKNSLRELGINIKVKKK